MKRAAFLLAFWLVMPAASQDLNRNEAAAVAQQQRERDEIQRLTMTVENLLDSNAVLHKRVTALTDELAALRREQARSSNAYASREDLDKVLQKIAQLERDREADQRKILAAIEDIKKVARSALSESLQSPAPSAPTGPLHEFEVQSGQTISGIVEAYNAEYRSQGKGSITVADVLRVNPGVRPERIRPGQIIKIPEPSR